VSSRAVPSLTPPYLANLATPGLARPDRAIPSPALTASLTFWGQCVNIEVLIFFFLAVLHVHLEGGTFYSTPSARSTAATTSSTVIPP